MKKYEFTGVSQPWIKGKTLHQIRAVRDFGNVHAGDIGGFIEKEYNLSHQGKAWITRDAKAYGDSKIYGNALITGCALISGDAKVYGNASVGGQSHIFGNAIICDYARIKRTTDYISISGFGESGGNITAFMSGDEIFMVCGNFNGSTHDFYAKMVEQYGNNKYTVEYFELIDLIKLHFNRR